MTLRIDRSTTRLAAGAPLQSLPYDSLGMDAESLKRGILSHLEYALAELPEHVDTPRGNREDLALRISVCSSATPLTLWLPTIARLAMAFPR